MDPLLAPTDHEVSRVLLPRRSTLQLVGRAFFSSVTVEKLAAGMVRPCMGAGLVFPTLEDGLKTS